MPVVGGDIIQAVLEGRIKIKRPLSKSQQAREDERQRKAASREAQGWSKRQPLTSRVVRPAYPSPGESREEHRSPGQGTDDRRGA